MRLIFLDHVALPGDKLSAPDTILDILGNGGHWGILYPYNISSGQNAVEKCYSKEIH